jgi:hypothetical protein
VVEESSCRNGTPLWILGPWMRSTPCTQSRIEYPETLVLNS